MIPVAVVCVASPTRTSAALNAYVRNEKKGQAKGERFVAAAGVNGAVPELMETMMRMNRKRWGKDGTRVVMKKHGVDENGAPVMLPVTEGAFVQGYHVILSYAKEGRGALDPNSPEDREIALRNAKGVLKRLGGKGRMGTVHLQIDGASGCLHAHLVIDSIDKLTGRSFDSSLVKHSELVATTNAVLAEQGYRQVNVYPKKGTVKSAEKTEKSELRGLAKYQAWEAGDKSSPEPFSVAVLKQRIRAALADERSLSWDRFVETAYEYGVDVENRGDNKRGIGYVMMRQSDALDDDADYLPQAKSDRRRASTLGRDFMMDAVEEAIQRNRELSAQRQATPVAPVAPAPVIEQEVVAEAAVEASVPSFSGVSLAELKRKSARSAPETHEKAPESLVEPEVTSDSQMAPKAVTGAPAASQGVYRSKLRDVKRRDQRRQALVLEVAAFDEQAREDLDIGYRINERLVPKGIGAQFLREYGDHLDPLVYEQLSLRQAKKDRAAELFEMGSKDDAAVLRHQIAAGNYETVAETAIASAQFARPSQEHHAVATDEQPVENRHTAAAKQYHAEREAMRAVLINDEGSPEQVPEQKVTTGNKYDE